MSKVSDSSFSPRWRKGTDIKLCYISDCTNTDIKVTKSVNAQQLEQLFEAEPTYANEGETENIPLCSHHYMQWYRHTHKSFTKCTTCGRKLRNYSKSRPVPEPELLQRFLNTNTEFNNVFCPNDCVCYTCYKSHSVIARHIKNLTISKDKDLNALILEIKQSLPRLSEIKNWDNAIDYTVHTLAISTGEALLKQTALLLPQVYVTFKVELDSIARHYVLCTEDNMPSPTWLRSSLSSLFQHHMAYRCSISKYGTLLYRYGGDLVHALTVALRKGHQTTKDSLDDSNDAMLMQVCPNINSKLHAQVTNSDSVQPHKI